MELSLFEISYALIVSYANNLLIINTYQYEFTGGPGKVLYFDMPQYIKGRQLKSYGGTLTYTILYRGQGRQTSQAPHVVLSVSIQMYDN